MISFRDSRAKELGAKLIVRTVDEAIAKGHATPAPGEISRNKLQIPVLLGAIEEFQFDCAIGGARRDEEKARAKERFFSFRIISVNGIRKPSARDLESLQRPGESRREHARVPALELDRDGRLAIHQARETRRADDLFQPRTRVFPPQWSMVASAPAHTDTTKPDPYAGARPKPTEPIKKMVVRVRTIADMISTGMIESPADSVDDIIGEVSAARASPNARQPAPTTKPAKPRWKTGKKWTQIQRRISNSEDFSHATPQHSVEILRFNTCGLRDDGSPRSSGACSTTRSR